MAKKSYKKKQSKGLKKTVNAYRKQRKRIRDFLSRNAKKGYIFPKGILPDIPEVIRAKDLHTLEKLTPDYLYKQAQYVNPDTGEVMSGEEGRKQRRKRKNKKEPTDYIIPPADDVIIDNILAQIELWVPSPWWSVGMVFARASLLNSFRSGFISLIDSVGQNIAAERLEARASEISSLIEEICYTSDEYDAAYSVGVVYSMIIGRSLTVEESKQLSQDIGDTGHIYV